MNSTYETNLRCRRLDKHGDWTFGNGNQDILDGREAMRQVVFMRLRAFRNEWWEGDRTALPYPGEVIEAYATEQNRRMIDLMIIDRLMDTRGVTEVKSLQSVIKDRQYQCSCTVATVYGEIEAEVVV